MLWLVGGSLALEALPEVPPADDDSPTGDSSKGSAATSPAPLSHRKGSPVCPTARSSSRSSTRGRTVRAPSCSSRMTSWSGSVAAVPPPRWHLLRYFGVLSSHSRLRKEVVPHPPADPSATAPPPAPGHQLELPLEAESDPVSRCRLARRERVRAARFQHPRKATSSRPVPAFRPSTVSRDHSGSSFPLGAEPESIPADAEHQP
jgi:hypothetical protein